MLNLELCSRILFTDESYFTHEDVNNMHNTHLWSPENPHQMSVHNFQNNSSFNIRCKVFNRLIGSHFKTSKRGNVPQFFAKSTASASRGCSLGDVTLLSIT
jgi:hypothetical protein